MARKIYVYTERLKFLMNNKDIHPSCVRCNDKRKAPEEFKVGDVIVSTHSGNGNGGHTTYYCFKHAEEVNLLTKSLRLNVGSGKNYLEDFVNVDVNSEFNPDIESDIRNCNFDPESFTEILCNDIIEKLTLKDARMMFRRFHSWLKKNGTLQIHTMNLDFLIETLRTSSNKEMRHEALKWLYATDGYNSAYWSNFVRWAYTKKSITEELIEAGYQVLNCEIDCLGFGMKVLAVKR